MPNPARIVDALAVPRRVVTMVPSGWQLNHMNFELSPQSCTRPGLGRGGALPVLIPYKSEFANFGRCSICRGQARMRDPGSSLKTIFFIAEETSDKDKTEYWMELILIETDLYLNQLYAATARYRRLVQLLRQGWPPSSLLLSRPYSCPASPRPLGHRMGVHRARRLRAPHINGLKISHNDVGQCPGRRRCAAARRLGPDAGAAEECSYQCQPISVVVEPARSSRWTQRCGNHGNHGFWKLANMSISHRGRVSTETTDALRNWKAACTTMQPASVRTDSGGDSASASSAAGDADSAASVSASALPVVSVGSRRSELALRQTHEVLRQLGPDCGRQFRIVHMDTIGDQILDRALSHIGDKGLFTQELDAALLSGQVQLVVHSLKDLPTQCPDGLAVPCILRRELPRDALVLHRAPRGGRRQGPGRPAARLRHRHVQPPPLGAAQPGAPGPPLPVRARGNLGTRWRKLNAQECGLDGLILAEAGLVRMGWTDRIACSLQHCLPAVGQGALAVQCRNDDQDTVRLLRPLLHRDSFLEAVAERSLLRALDGGCSVPLGVRSVWSEAAGDAPRRLKLEARVLSVDGTEVFEFEADEALTEDVGEEEAGPTSAKRRRQSAGEATKAEAEAEAAESPESPERFIGLHYPEPDGRDRRHLAACVRLGRRVADGLLALGAGPVLAAAKAAAKSAAGKLAPPALSELPRCGQPLQLLARAAASLRRLLSSPELLPGDLVFLHWVAAAAEPVGEEEQQAGRHLEAAADAVHQLPEPAQMVFVRDRVDSPHRQAEVFVKDREIEPMASGFISRELGILKRCLKAELMNLDTIGYSYGFSSYFIMMRVNCTAAMVPTTLMQKNSTSCPSCSKLCGPTMSTLSQRNRNSTGNAVAEIVLTTAWYRLMCVTDMGNTFDTRLLIMMARAEAPARLTPEMVAGGGMMKAPNSNIVPRYSVRNTVLLYSSLMNCSSSDKPRPAMLVMLPMASTLPEVVGAAAIPAAATGGGASSRPLARSSSPALRSPLTSSMASSGVFTSTMQPAGRCEAARLNFQEFCISLVHSFELCRIWFFQVSRPRGRLSVKLESSFAPAAELSFGDRTHGLTGYNDAQPPGADPHRIFEALREFLGPQHQAFVHRDEETAEQEADDWGHCAHQEEEACGIGAGEWKVIGGPHSLVYTWCKRLTHEDSAVTARHVVHQRHSDIPERRSCDTLHNAASELNGKRDRLLMG
uniref:hydroxymethylbilane synthase n=1 Tax=Macrostomum lignano TaxID=282301 RepID=A0A1I8IWC1_9PLAT